MNSKLQNRLDKIEPLVTAPKFLERQGIGNEIACYIFDYPAEHELQVREYVKHLSQRLRSGHKSLDWCEVNLLDAMTGYLDSRKLLARAIDMQAKKDDAGVIRALLGPLSPEKLCSHIAEVWQPAKCDLVFLSGVGSVWPVVRLHGLLNALHQTLDGTPLVVFYPGRFDGVSLSLFDRADTREDTRATTAGKQPYYRAFTLVPEDV